MKKKFFVCLMFIGYVLSNVCFGAKFNMSYINSSTTVGYIEKVDATNSSLNEVSPSYFDINEDGTLCISEYITEKFVKEMHERNVLVVPFLSNHWNREIGRAGLKNREKLATQIVEAINRYELDGVNVDIENVTEVDRDNYTDFVRILAEKMPEGKTLAVAVAANPKGYTTGWHGSYDYIELGKYASYIMVMTYDEHWEGSTPGAVAGYDFMEKSIQEILKYVPAEKVVLGIAFYGRYWNSSGVGGRAATFKLIDKIFKDYTPTIRFDEESKTMVGRIIVTKEQAENDDYLFAAGTYDFWYDNNDTIKEKMKLVEKYNLKGTGSWALGSELADLWNEYTIWLNGEKKHEDITNEVFNDISISRWSYSAVEFVNKRKLMIGKTEKVFGTTDSLTRAEAITVILRMIEQQQIYIGEKDNQNEFSDIQEHWAKDSIQKAVRYGVISGYEDKTFRPNNPISREELVAILAKLNLNIEETQKISFSDVEETRWSYQYIRKCASKGILNGYADGTFKPTEYISREETAKILYSICK